MSDVPIVVEVTPLPDIVVEVPVYGTAPGGEGTLVDHYVAPIVAGVADVAAAVAAGYSTIIINVVAETAVDAVMPDPETTPPFDLAYSDPTGACVLTFSGASVILSIFDLVNISTGGAVVYWARVVPTEDDPAGPAWTMIPQFGGGQLGGTVDVVSNVATSTILGRTTAGSGDSEELSVSSARSLLSVTDGWTKAMVQPAVGEWWPTPFATMYPGATQLNRVCYVPIWIPAGVTMIDGIAVEVTTTLATALGRLGLYTANATTRKPDALVIDAGTVDCSAGGGAAGVRTLACTATAVTPDSLYYVAYCAQTATAAVRQAASGAILKNFSIPSSTASEVFVRTETLGWIEWPVTGALPSTATPTRFAVGDVQPILALKRNTC